MTNPGAASQAAAIKAAQSQRAKAVEHSEVHTPGRYIGLALDLGGCVRACRGVQGVVPVSVELVAV